MNVVRELITVLGFSVNPQGVNEYEKRIEMIPGRVKPVVNQLRNMFAGVFAGLGAVSGFRAIVDAGDQMTRVMNRVSESATVPTEAFEALYASARETGVAMDQTSKSFMRIGPAMRRAGFNDNDTISMLDGLQKGLLAAGSTASETASVLTQLGQAIGSNNFAGDELKSFLENSSDTLIQSFARALNTTSDALKKMGSEGKLNNSIVLPGLIAASKTARDSFGRMTVTVELAMARSRVAWIRFAGELQNTLGLNDKLVKGFAAIGNALDWLRMRFSVIEEFIRQQVGLRNILEFVGVTLTAVYGPALLRMLALATGAALRFAFAVGLPAVGVALLALGIQDVLTFMRGGESITAKFIEGFDPAFIGGFKDALITIKDTMVAALEASKEFATYMGGVFKSALETVVGFINKTFGEGTATVAGFGEQFQRTAGIVTASIAAIVAGLATLKAVGWFAGLMGVGFSRSAAKAAAKAAAGAAGAGAAEVGAGAAGAAVIAPRVAPGLGNSTLFDTMRRATTDPEFRDRFRLPQERRMAERDPNAPPAPSLWERFNAWRRANGFQQEMQAAAATPAPVGMNPSLHEPQPEEPGNPLNDPSVTNNNVIDNSVVTNPGQVSNTIDNSVVNNPAPNITTIDNSTHTTSVVRQVQETGNALANWLRDSGLNFRRDNQDAQPSVIRQEMPTGGVDDARSAVREWFERNGFGHSNSAENADPAVEWLKRYGAPNANGMPSIGSITPPNQTINNNPTINQEINVTAPASDGASLGSTVGIAARDAGENAMRFGNELARDLLRGNPMTEAGAR